MKRSQYYARSVLILENDKDLANCIRLYLEDAYHVYTTPSPTQLRKYVTKYKINIVITDLDSPFPDLSEYLIDIKKIDPQIKIIVICMFLDDDEKREQFVLKEADDYIFKPFDADVLKFKLNKLVSPA